MVNGRGRESAPRVNAHPAPLWRHRSPTTRPQWIRKPPLTPLGAAIATTTCTDSASNYELHQQLTTVINDGHRANSDTIGRLIADHYKFNRNTWGTTPSEEAYTGLADLCLNDLNIRATFDQVHPQLAPVLSEAMKIYVQRERR